MNKRKPLHRITEARDWAKIVLAAGTALAAIITAVGEVISRLS